MTLEEQVRQIIGDGGPQLPTSLYEARINEELDNMSPRELLYLISLALEVRE